MEFNVRGDYFDGNFHLAPLSGTNAVEKVLEKESPANLEHKLWTMPVENGHIDKVIESSIKGYKSWKRTTIKERSTYLKKFQDEVTKRKDEIAKSIALETGKPLWEAYTEVSAVIAKVDVTLNESLSRISNVHTKGIMAGVDGHVYYKPIGPCFIIGPFNFPCHLANGQILSALIAGNSVIFKPSEKTAYSGQLLAECIHAAEFPAGVFNMIQGDGGIARRILIEKEVKGVFFTGSKEVGSKILKDTCEHLDKLVALELGGKNTCIVHKDAHLDHALMELIKASFLTTGQRCVSTSKIAIHHSIKDEFIEKFHNLSKKLVIDHPIEHEIEPFMGPLIDHKSLENYLVFMGMAIREGAQEVMRGKQLHKNFKGHYVTPSIHYLENPDPNGHFISAELFGPNVTFIPYNEIEEAVEISNMSEYGLASGVFSSDRSIYDVCVRELDCGVVNFNRSTCGSSSKLPFGGIKNSGNYRPAAVAMIDSCVYPMASLEQVEIGEVDFSGTKGLTP